MCSGNMKYKKDIPQGKSALDILIKEICYVKISEGKCESDLISGWSVKINALNIALDLGFELNAVINKKSHRVK